MYLWTLARIEKNDKFIKNRYVPVQINSRFSNGIPTTAINHVFFDNLLWRCCVEFWLKDGWKKKEENIGGNEAQMADHPSNEIV